MHEIWSLDIVGEWRIGLDAADLFGLITQKLGENFKNSHLTNKFNEFFLGTVDELQAVIDKTHFCSEFHGIVKKQN